MKKLIILSILLLPITVFAQSPGDRMIASEGFKNMINTKAIGDSLKKANEKIKLEQAKKQKQQEEKVVKIKKEAESICIEITKNDKNKEDSKFVCILKAVLLGGKYPWESEQDYKLRLQMSTFPASQPFK